MIDAAGLLTFDELYRLRNFIARFREYHVATLLLFEDKASRAFKQSQHRKDKSDLSMSSTATCIGSLAQTGLWASDNPDTKNWWEGREADYLHKFLYEDWDSAGLPKDNPFTVGFVVEACADLELVCSSLKKNDEQVKKHEAAVRILKSELQKEATPEGSVSVLEYPPSAYLTQLVARSLKRANQLDEKMSRAITRWSLQEISAQLAFFSADSRVADSLQLAYAVVCAMSYCAPSDRTPTDLELIKAGLRTFFLKQLPNGGWPQSRPLFHYPTFGSAYCYDYEALAQMLLCEELQESLILYLRNLGDAAYALDDIKFDLGGGAYGWASNQTPQVPGPESWSTASVYLFLHALDRLVAEAIRRAISSELEVTYTGVKDAKNGIENFAKDFLDCPFSASDGETRLFKKMIYDIFAEPAARSAKIVAGGKKLPRNVKMSAIFFGPPGTSKTEIVDQIAEYIGWPAVTVDPSYFVKAGLDQIQAQANKIFRMLAASEQLVVLFDEFDEMVRARAESGELLSRFLTTAMLPKLALINKERRILFIVATNYIHTFDVAIARPGRFDLVLQMMPPSAPEKLRKWPTELEALQQLVTDGSFEGGLQDLTFTETQALVRRLQTAETAEDKKRVWAEAVAVCVIRKPNDRSGHNGAVVEPDDPPANPQSTELTWKTTAKAEVKFIRSY